MKNPIQYQRQMALQLHCGIHAFCFVVTFICMLFLRFEDPGGRLFRGFGPHHPAYWGFGSLFKL